ncbi:hypothetical protein B0H13DRAFT_1935702 [Mycena leptocephala]|nr:hypothetical protein B0H13DRAFT_1935702 [Mycena leptocephala]
MSCLGLEGWSSLGLGERCAWTFTFTLLHGLSNSPGKCFSPGGIWWRLAHLGIWHGWRTWSPVAPSSARSIFFGVADVPAIGAEPEFEFEQEDVDAAGARRISPSTFLRIASVCQSRGAAISRDRTSSGAGGVVEAEDGEEVVLEGVARGRLRASVPIVSSLGSTPESKSFSCVD